MKGINNMNKFILKKIIAGAMATAIALSTGVTAFAADTQQITPDNTGNTTVKATVESEAVVWLPTNITVSGTPDENKKYTGEGAVIVEGDIAGDQLVTVTPESSIYLKQSGKDDIIAQVTQEKTTFTYDDLQNSNSTVTSISADTLSAGEWNSVLHYNVSLDENPLPPGYTTLYEYDLSATEADDVKAYYMVPNKNTSPIEVETQENNSKAGSITGSIKSLFTPITAYASENVIEYNGIRYELSDEDKLIISGSGEMKENIQSELIDYQGIADAVLEHFPNISIGRYVTTVSYNLNKYEMDDINKDYIIYFYSDGNEYYPRWIAQKTEVIDGNFVNGKPLSIDDDFYNEVIDYIDSIYLDYAVTLPKEVIINEGVTNVSDSAFKNCKTLENITLPNSLETIDKNAFYQCSNLKEVSFPEGLKSIGEGAFYYTPIESIYLPDSVESIGIDAFSMCRSLKNISLPKSVNLSIGKPYENCFNYIASGAIITYRGSINDYLSLDWSMNQFKPTDFEFYTNDDTETLNIPSNYTTIKDYAFAYGWDYITDINIPEGVTQIGEYAFRSLKNLKSVNMTDSVISIGKYAFADCSNLTTISLSNNLSTLSDGLFYYCDNLSDEIVLPEKLVSIGNNTFEHCRALEIVNLPQSVTSIGSKAFYHCYALTEITIPESVISVGNNAFMTGYNASKDNDLSIYCETPDVAALFIDGQNYNSAISTGKNTQKITSVIVDVSRF